MKKSKLIVDHNFDFELAGIISNAKGYKLTWEINRVLKLNLVKAKDLVLSFIDNNHLTILNYKYETENNKLLLIKNRGVESDGIPGSFLIPELQRFDYLLWARSVDEFDFVLWIDKIKELKVIQYAIRIDIEKLKSKENLLF